jgi:hypothetical protein
MADYYTQLSFAISNRNKKEAEWWNKFISNPAHTMAKLFGIEKCQEEWDIEFEYTLESETAEANEKDIDEDSTYLGLGAYFEVRKNGKKRSIWIYSEESANVDAIASILQEFLKTCRPEGKIGFSWANNCSRPILDSFSGGYCMVSAKKIVFSELPTWTSKDN